MTKFHFEQKHLLIALALWVAGISGLVGYLGYKEFTRSQELSNTTKQFNSLSSTLDTVQNNVATLNSTTNQTLQGMTITYNGDDLNTYLETNGHTTVSGYLLLNETAGINITDIFSNATYSTCNCTGLAFYNFTVLNSAGSDTNVFISSDFSKYCQITFDPYHGNQEACVDIINPCREVLVLDVPYVSGNTIYKTVARINRSYGSVCV